MANTGLPGGGGGSGGSGGDSGGGSGPGITWDMLLSVMPTKVGAVLTAIAALTVARVTTLVNFIEHPILFIRNVIQSFLYTTFLKPIATSVFNAGRAVVGSILFIGFGSDGSFGISEGSSIGIFDIPWIIINPILLGVGDIYDALGNLVTQVNNPIINGLTNLGVAAPIVSPMLLAVEVSFLVWATWVLISTIDVPLIKAQSMATAITGPLRRAIRWLIE